MFDFEKPKIEIAEISEDKRYGKFVVEPLERGYGTTLGSIIRRHTPCSFSRSLTK